MAAPPPLSRFDRQFLALERHFPALGKPLRAIRTGRWRIVRMPIAILLICGGFLAILPVFNLWMLPIGLLLLAVDLPFLQGPIGSLMVRVRRRVDHLRRRLKR